VKGDKYSLTGRSTTDVLARRGVKGASLAHWADVATVVNARMTERGTTQRELAETSGVSVATLRKIQGGEEQQRTRGTLANISRALGFTDDYLWRISQGHSPSSAGSDNQVSALRAELADLTRRVEVLESQASSASD
jgi:transcriptional regulator with XRE-family HTH domain